MEQKTNNSKEYIIGFISLAVLVLLILGIFLLTGNEQRARTSSETVAKETEIASILMPKEIALPVIWSDYGKQMIEQGVIDKEKFESLYEKRGGLDPETRKLLFESNNREIVITQQNAGVLLNVLWAFGLSNKNMILEEGPMMDPKYGGAGRFASTGGGSIARGNAMDHYSKYEFVTLTPEQQRRVEEVSKNIYRPCCGNSTYFPDCNHGMAMLGLLELLAANDTTEDEMYTIALGVNALWFPSTYSVLAQYVSENNLNDITPKELLSYEYSSASGYRSVLAKVKPTNIQGGAGCGV
ncbi:hypothetical protein CL654_01930 [bacterium]|nr:hypothetical protein [bacterium]